MTDTPEQDYMDRVAMWEIDVRNVWEELNPMIAKNLTPKEVRAASSGTLKDKISEAMIVGRSLLWEGVLQEPFQLAKLYTSFFSQATRSLTGILRFLDEITYQS